ncbi:MAG: replication-associated recombination protein A [Campylobacterales bacterium]
MKSSLSQALRPKTLDDFIGQKHLLASQAPFRRLVESDSLSHSFFYGPPGSGKTSLAFIIASLQDRVFYTLNATSLKIDEIRKIVAKHRGEFIEPMIFIDEVHRLSKTQQEVLLPIMEEGSALVFGASTENPYFSLTSAIRSRSMLFEFKPLSNLDLEEIIKKSGVDKDLADGAREFLIKTSNGNARAMLNLIDAALAQDTKPITTDMLRQIRPYSMSAGSASSDEAYNLISALIKSVRGSDENASIYYLGRLVSEGENPEYIARRMLILASEDIGNANPNALVLANSAMQSVAKIGYPEARIILSQLVLYLASSPKSNLSYNAINRAVSMVESGDIYEIPKNIVHFKEGYKYPHDYGGWIEQSYLSEDVELVEWDRAKGFELKLKEWIEKIKEGK